MVTNYELKQRARAALRDNGRTALLVVLIATMFSVLMSVADILTGVDLGQQLLQIVADLMGGRSLQQALVNFLASSETTSGISFVLTVAMIVVTPVLNLGRFLYMFKLHQGDETACMETVFARKEYFWPALGLDLMVSLRIIGWGLLGAVPLLLGMLFPEGGIRAMLLLAGVIAAAALFCRAAYEYEMAYLFFAEDPQMGISASIQASKEMMAHRKMQLFVLDLSFILFDLGIIAAQVLLVGVLGSMLSALLGVALHLPVTVYRDASFAAFYLEFRSQHETKTETSLLERWNNDNEL